MAGRWTFTADADPRLMELRQQLLARSSQSADTFPLGKASFEVRAVTPSISVDAPSLGGVVRAFLSDLGPGFPPLRTASLLPLEMDQVEAGMWGQLVGGVVCDCGVFDGEPDSAADWVASLLVCLDEDGGSRHFRAPDLFDVRGWAEGWIVVATTRVAMVCLVGSD